MIDVDYDRVIQIQMEEHSYPNLVKVANELFDYHYDEIMSRAKAKIHRELLAAWSRWWEKPPEERKVG